MKRARLVAYSLRALVAGTALISIQKPIIGKSVAGKDRSASASQAADPRILESYGKLPLSFEANQGQTDSQVKFISRGNGYSLFLTSTEAVLNLQGPPAGKDSRIAQISPTAFPSAPSAKSAAVVTMKLAGANPSPQLTGQDELPGKSNYLIGNDPAKWRTNVTNYAKVQYADVYPGIDLVYYGNQRQLEYDFVVSPGADPRTIRLAIGGDEQRRIDGQGDLVLGAEGNEIRVHRPVVYQEIGGSRRSVGGNFVMRRKREVGFEIARYDASKPLIIDPVLSYSTYLGGSSGDLGYGIAVDSAGNAYVTGATASTDFPTANAFQAANGGGRSAVFVTKLNAAGSALVYSTYLGGSGDGVGLGIAVDSSGNAYVTGYTGSTNFPTANAFQTTMRGRGNAFVTKLNATGSALVYSTYLGGSNFDAGQGIAVDSSGNALVTGIAYSTNFPTANAFQRAYGGDFSNAFVTKLNASGSALVYSTYLGGNRGGDDGDWANGIAVDSSGNAYVTGYASSPDFPLVNAFQTANNCCEYEYTGDAFVTKFDPAGSALYSTRLGGSAYDEGFGIAADSSGNAYVTGITYSTDFPRRNAFQGAVGSGAFINAFVTKLNPDGSALVYSTYLGGSGFDAGEGFGIAVDPSGNAYVTGHTTSIDFPTANAFQAALRGYENAFVTKLNAAGSALTYSTFLGGGGSDVGRRIAVDPSGNAYVTGTACSYDFPLVNAVQTVNANPNCLFGGGTAFVSKLTALPAVPDPWQQAISAMKTAAGTDSLNFWQWSWYWQNTPAFNGAPAGFGAAGSISPGLITQLTTAGGGDPLVNLSAEQWVLYYRQVVP